MARGGVRGKPRFETVDDDLVRLMAIPFSEAIRDPSFIAKRIATLAKYEANEEAIHQVRMTWFREERERAQAECGKLGHQTTRREDLFDPGKTLTYCRRCAKVFDVPDVSGPEPAGG